MYNKNFQIIHGKDITENHIKSILDLDYMVYDEIYYLDVNTCIKYHQKNPDIYFIALNDSKELIGYINFSPIKEDLYNLLKSGTVIDTVITANDLLDYKPNNQYSIYFSSICVHPDYRHIGVAKELLKSLIDFIDELKKSNITIKRIIADAVSKSGEKILRSNEFDFIRYSEHGTKIMEKIL